MTMNDTWGFSSDDQNWKSAETLIRNLIDIASKGGNYLLNVGPTAEGEIPGPSVERLAAIGTWMKKNGESIYAHAGQPVCRDPVGTLHAQDARRRHHATLPARVRLARRRQADHPGRARRAAARHAAGRRQDAGSDAARQGGRHLGAQSAPDTIATVVVLELSKPVTLCRRYPVNPVHPVSSAARRKTGLTGFDGMVVLNQAGRLRVIRRAGPGRT